MDFDQFGQLRTAGHAEEAGDRRAERRQLVGHAAEEAAHRLGRHLRLTEPPRPEKPGEIENRRHEDDPDAPPLDPAAEPDREQAPEGEGDADAERGQ